jgi:hypothetical protein
MSIAYVCSTYEIKQHGADRGNYDQHQGGDAPLSPPRRKRLGDNEASTHGVVLECPLWELNTKKMAAFAFYGLANVMLISTKLFAIFALNSSMASPRSFQPQS